MDIKPGLVKKFGPRTVVELISEQTSSMYEDSMLNVVFPSGRLEIGIPNREVYTGVKLFCGIWRQPLSSGPMDEIDENRGMRTLPQMSMVLFLEESGARRTVLNMAAKLENQDIKSGVLA